MTPEEISQERSKRLRSAFLDQEFGGAKALLDDNTFGGAVEDKEAFLTSSAVAGWAGVALNRHVNPASPEWQGIKDGIARGYFKNQAASNVSDNDMFGMIAADYQAQDKIANASRIAAARGESWLGKFREVETANAGSMLPGRMTNYLGLARAAHDEMAAKVAPYRNTIKTVTDMARNIDTAPDGMNWGAMASELIKVPKEDRPYVLEAISNQAAGSDFAAASSVQRLAKEFDRFLGSYLDSAASSVLGVAMSDIEASAKNNLFLTDAQSGEVLAASSAVGDYMDLRDDVREISIGNLAKLKAVEFAGMNISGAVQNIPMTIGSFIPYVGAAVTLGSFQRSTYNEIRRSNPTMSRDAANTIATISAPIQAITEIASDRFLFGRLPNLKRAFTQPIFSATGALSMFTTRAAIGTATEVGEEFAQGITPMAVQSIASALNSDIPGSDWDGFLGEFAQNMPELISTILPLAIVGAGTGQLSDFRAGRQMARSTDMLIAAQYSPESAAKISELANAGKWSEAEDAMRGDWAKINAKGDNVAQVKATAEQRMQAAERLRGLQKEQVSAEGLQTTSPEYTASVTRTPTGWQVTTGEGTIIPVESAEAARRIAVDLRQVGSQEEADTLVSVIDGYYEQGKQAETVLTGETVQASNIEAVGVVATRRDAGGAILSQRQLGPQALETVRAEAEVAGIKTGTQGVFAHINGSNEVFPMRVADGAKEIVRQMNLYKSQSEGQPQVITFLHESFESTWRLGMTNGTFSDQETRRAMGALLPAFEGVTALNAEEAQFIANLRTLANGQGNETMLRETVSEMVIRDVLGRDRQGRATGMKPGSISRAIEASVMGANTQEEASALKSILAAIKAFTAYLKGVFGTVDAITKARDEGKLGEEYDTFINKVLGIDEVKQMESQAIDEGRAMLGIDEETQAVIDAGNMAFSTSRAQPADTSNVTEMPDGAQLVGPTTFSISPAQDAEYLAAAKAGDTETAQRLVDQLAMSAGYNSPKLYHGTGAEFSIFDKKRGGSSTDAKSAKIAFFFTDDEATAKAYAVYAAEEGPVKDALKKAELAEKRGDWDGYDAAIQEAESLDNYESALKRRESAKVVSTYLKGDFLEFDAKGKTPQELSDGDTDKGITNQLLKAQRAGKTGVLFKNLDDAVNLNNRPSNHYAVFKPDQIKSADPITYDDAGNIIPLSQRFNEATPDIRFSISRVSEEERITPENKVAPSINGKPAADIFAEVKKRHGITRSIYEAGYVLPDGTMLDFTGRADVGDFKQGPDLVFRVVSGRDWMKDQRGVDHREIEWQDMPDYQENWERMVGFLRLGAVRVDARSGMISMHSRAKITAAQASVLKSIVVAADGAYIDLEDDARNRSSMQLNGGKWGKVNGLLTRWANGETPEFAGQSFSISPVRNLNELSDQVEKQFAENPVGALKVKSRVIRQFAKLADKWSNERWTPQGNKIRPISEKRTVKSLDKEQAMRQAQREVELTHEGMDKLTTETLLAYSEGVGTLQDDPLIARMLNDNGKLMSKATAEREGRGIKDQYDDAGWLPPQFYARAGGIMPDVMANNLGFDYASEMWAALESSIKSHRTAKAGYAKAEDAVKAVERAAFEQARKEAQAWRNETDAMQKEDWSPRESLVRDLITLEAIIAMFPQEIRGKIGGFVALARKASESARLKVLQKQLERGQVLLEKHLKDQYGEATDKLLKRFKSQKDASGRITGKIISTATEQVDYAAEFIKLGIEEQSDRQAALEKKAEESEDANEVQDALTKLGIARLFDMYSDKDSASRESAFNWLNDTIEAGKLGKKIIDEARKEMLTEMRQSAQSSILAGDELNPDVADNITNLNKGVFKRALLNLRGMLSEALWTTIQRLELIFGEDSKILNYFAEKIINAANLSTDIKRLVEAQKKDALSIIFNSDSKFAHARGIAELQKVKQSGISTRRVKKEEVKLDIETLTKLNDGTMSAETAGLEQYEVDAALEEFAANARKSTVTIEKVVNAGTPVERTMSETQGIQWWLWSMQDASRKQMERDGWDADSFKQLEEFLSPEAKALGRWISGSYQDAAGMIDPIYRKLFNAPLPRIKNYSPIHRRNMSTGGDIMDIDGSDMNSGLAAGFVKARVNTTASLVEMDALAVFLAHWENVSHWVSHAELMRDMKAILLDKDTAVAIRQKKSEGYLQRLKDDVKTIEKNGTNSASELVNISRVWRWFMQYRSYKGLAFRLSPIIKQTPALLNPLIADVPAHNYMMGMARAFIEPQSFAKEVSAMWSSDIIRRRIEAGFSAESRVAMQGAGMTGSQAIVAMQAGMMPMSMVDGGWTALGAAISFDYYRRGYMRDNSQMTPEIADAKAIARVEKMIATSAQPSDVYARSLSERSGNPFMKSMSMFVSDQRKALAIELMAIRRLATGKSKNKTLDIQRAFVAHFVQAGVSQVMAVVIASLLGDDEDRDRELSREQWTLALALGPINGLFVFGRLADKIGRGLLGLRVFPADDLASKVANDLLKGGKNMDELFNPDDADDFMDALDSSSTALGAGMSAAIGPAGGAVDVGANVLREARKIQKRLSE